MLYRDRIKELRRVRASELRASPRNWRTHPPRQKEALQSVLQQVGYADALLAREADDGALELIDGHLRAETTPNMLVPVLVLDVSQQEADVILATHDPLTGMAEHNTSALAELLSDTHINSDELNQALAGLVEESPDQLSQLHVPSHENSIPDVFHILVQCADERVQEALYNQLKSEGHTCRVVTL